MQKEYMTQTPVCQDLPYWLCCHCLGVPLACFCLQTHADAAQLLNNVHMSPGLEQNGGRGMARNDIRAKTKPHQPPKDAGWRSSLKPNSL